jgi:FkbM family methyltransferase
MRHFLATLDQIAHAESVGTFEGIRRHFQWQARRLIGGFPCELPISQSKLRVTSPRGVSALVNAMGEYDYNNMRFVRSSLKHSGGTFFDVGANIGAYTLIASEISGAKVVSMEPHPQTFAVLADNVRLNARHNVTCLQVAVSDREGTTALTDGLESSLNHVLHDGEGAGRTIEVRSQRLETICESTRMLPDIIKIDVEGHEPAVLRGLGRYRAVARAILVEGGDRLAIQDWMRISGYSGPWFVHFNQAILAKRMQARGEDPIFVRGDLVPQSRSLNGGEPYLDLSELMKPDFRDRGLRTCPLI